MTRTMDNAVDPTVLRQWLDQALYEGEHALDPSPPAPDRIARMLLALRDRQLASTVAALPDSALTWLLATLDPGQRNTVLRRLARAGAAPREPEGQQAPGNYVEEDALAPLADSLRSRVPWLLLNLLTAFLAAAVVAPFESTISRIASLAVFMPVIAGHGGNTGTQVATIIVRSLATGDLGTHDLRVVLRKEAAFGLVHGLLAGLLTAAYALILNQNLWLAAVVVVAMVGNVFAAGLAGCAIPLALRRAGQDPALASSIWLTTLTDMFGFVLLLELGTVLVTKLS
ncbi:MAG TPA: magnesium transporter [Dehalococcoidia bacterium]|nr:magnesium transporter [Dehalococcoidia bacterium]